MESQMESQIGSAQVCLATLFPFHHFLDDTDFFFADFLLFFPLSDSLYSVRYKCEKTGNSNMMPKLLKKCRSLAECP